MQSLTLPLPQPCFFASMYSALFPLDIMWQAAPSYSILKGLARGYFYGYDANLS
jgi:hypothetical protein